jgi:hypothetical protein
MEWMGKKVKVLKYISSGSTNHSEWVAFGQFPGNRVFSDNT